MIRVTRLNGERFALNPDLVERVEGHPDTVVVLVDGTKYVVRESVEEVLVEIREYRASILATAYEMDRGTYHSPLDRPGEEGTGPALGGRGAGQSSVVPFPAREER